MLHCTDVLLPHMNELPSTAIAILNTRICYTSISRYECTLALLVEALCCKQEGCGFDSRWANWIFQ